MKKYDITALGEILIDFTPQGEDDFGDKIFVRKAGGAPLNLLATASKAGLKVAFISKVGADMFGTFLKQSAQECGIDTAAITTDPIYNTTLAFVTLNENGDRDFAFYRNFGADTKLQKEDIDLDIIENSRIFHFGSLSFTSGPSKESSLYALKKAKELGLIISYDPNYREPLWESEHQATTVMKENIKYADIAKLSLEEAQMITDIADPNAAIKAICQMGVSAVLITNGGGGVHFGTRDKALFLPTLDIKPIDTTGAGDIFFGTFLSCFIKSGSKLDDLDAEKMAEFVKYAIEISGKSTLKYGGVASIPDIKI